MTVSIETLVAAIDKHLIGRKFVFLAPNRGKIGNFVLVWADLFKNAKNLVAQC